MSETSAPSTPTNDRLTAVENVRAKVFDGLADYQTVAAALGKTVRTVTTMVARGDIATVKIGRDPYVIIASLRDLIRKKQEQAPRGARGRGRPRKAA